MREKVIIVRNYILNMLEQESIKPGEYIEGARKITQKVDAAFTSVQEAISSLIQDGILSSAPRKGVLVNEDWRDKLVWNHFVSKYPSYHWHKDFEAMLSRRLPWLYFARFFKKGILEIMPTLELQFHQNEYLDLFELFPKDFFDEDTFFSKALNPFIVNGKLIGIPFVFSPRILCCNPKLLARYGCDIPSPGWTWEDFKNILRKLKKHLPNHNILHPPFFHIGWMNALLNAGGSLMSKKADGSCEVALDSAKTKKGLKLWMELFDIVGYSSPYWNSDRFHARQNIISGELAFFFMSRMSACTYAQEGFSDWQPLSQPSVPGGEGWLTQSTDAVCVRKECPDISYAKEFISAMLSENSQDFISRTGYGIPFRKAPAMRSIDFDNSKDVVFLNEIPRMQGTLNVDSPELFTLIDRGLTRIMKQEEEFEAFLTELANTARVYLKVMNYTKP